MRNVHDDITPKKGERGKCKKIRCRSNPLLFQPPVHGKYIGIMIKRITYVFFPSKYIALTNQFSLDIFMSRTCLSPLMYIISNLDFYITSAEFSKYLFSCLTHGKTQSCNVQLWHAMKVIKVLWRSIKCSSNVKVEIQKGNWIYFRFLKCFVWLH